MMRDPLPTCAVAVLPSTLVAPVLNRPRKGRFPSNVHSLRKARERRSWETQQRERLERILTAAINDATEERLTVERFIAAAQRERVQLLAKIRALQAQLLDVQPARS